MISLATDSESFLTAESYGPENISVPTPLTELDCLSLRTGVPLPSKGKGKGKRSVCTQARFSELQTEAELANHSPWHRE